MDDNRVEIKPALMEKVRFLAGWGNMTAEEVVNEAVSAYVEGALADSDD